MNIFHIKYNGETCIYFEGQAVSENENSDAYVLLCKIQKFQAIINL